MTNYVLTDIARADLESIIDFIAQDNPSAAERVLKHFQDAMRNLAEMPKMGSSRRDLADEEVRFWPVHSYLVIYRPQTKPLQVIRILSGYRDIAELLKND